MVVVPPGSFILPLSPNPSLSLPIDLSIARTNLPGRQARPIRSSTTTLLTKPGNKHRASRVVRLINRQNARTGMEPLSRLGSAHKSRTP